MLQNYKKESCLLTFNESSQEPKPEITQEAQSMYSF